MARGGMASIVALDAGMIDAGTFVARTSVGRRASGVHEEAAGGEAGTSAASWIDPITGWRPDLTRRLRVLLHAEPLLTLRANDGRVAEEIKHYDSLTLVFRLFDLLIEHTGIDVGLSAPDVRAALTPLLSAMDGAAGVLPDARRHDAVVDRVLGGLLNDAARREKFAGHYCVVGPNGQAAKVVFHYRLLEEVHREGDGEIVLRLTNEAINLYIGALDREIEDEQAAAEQVIHEQLQRGSFARAVQTARDALFQSRRYSEKIDRVLDLTRRDVRQADWRTEVPALLSAAGDHLTRRISAERAILSSTLAIHAA